MKFKRENFVVYKNCIFSEPEDNSYEKPRRDYRSWQNSTKTETLKGKKIKVKCSNVSYFSYSNMYKNRLVHPKGKETYKDSKLLDRMLKIGEINYKSHEYEI